LAKENDVNFMFEAAVGGGIPVIRPLTFCLRANNIRSVNGILNGTTNFILTKMIKENMSFEDALKIAQDNGYAEKDPTADVEGHDACRKICILAALAFGNHVYPKNVHCEGITKIALEDVANVSGIGAIKLIGTAEKLPDGKLYILVSPAVVLSDCQLSAVSDVFNAVMIDGDATDEVLFYGKGAGSLPTASAVVADVLDCAEHSERRRPVFWGPEKPELIADYREVENKFYVRGAALDENLIDTKLNDDAYITKPITENALREKLDGEPASLIRVARL
ncbi:MAG: homoserine dehydrogenase, partial [Clostridia bacterium]|nr:homoserine dehydrogenase [Clostridia bacterium]